MEKPASPNAGGTTATLERLVAGNLCFDRSAHGASVGGRAAELTHQEFELLGLLIRRPNQVVDREAMCLAMWGRAGRTETKRLTVIIARLREKLVGSQPYAIETVRFRGYGLLLDRACDRPKWSAPNALHQRVSR